MNKELKNGIAFLVPGMFFFWIGMTILTYYKNIHGDLATALWLSGIFTYMGITGIGYTIRLIIEKFTNHDKDERLS